MVCHNTPKHFYEMKREYILKGMKRKYVLMLDLINLQNSSHFVSKNEILKLNSASSKIVAKIVDYNKSGIGRITNGTKKSKLFTSLVWIANYFIFLNHLDSPALKRSYLCLLIGT